MSISADAPEFNPLAGSPVIAASQPGSEPPALPIRSPSLLRPAGPVGTVGQTPWRGKSRAEMGFSPEGAAPKASTVSAALDFGSAAMSSHSHGPTPAVGGAGMPLTADAASFDPTTAGVPGQDLLGPGPFAPESLVQQTPRVRSYRGQFMPDDAEAHYHRLAVEAAQALPDGHSATSELPPGFKSAMPLDSTSKHSGVTGSTGFPTRVFKAVNQRDGVAYCVRRVEGVRVPRDVLLTVVAKWNNPAHDLASHPTLVALRFSPAPSQRDRASFFAHDYVPGARSMLELFLGERRSEAPPLTESLLWSVLTDCLLCLRAVHTAGLSLHGVSLQRLLLGPDGRCKLSGAGVLEALDHESERPLAAMQASDIRGLAACIAALVLDDARVASPDAAAAALAALSGRASPPLASLLSEMLSPSRPMLASAAIDRLSHRVPDLYQGMLRRVEALDTLLAMEAGSGRMLRLMIKLSQVLDRPEADVDPSWGGGGEKAALAAMRDVVFHQTDDSGRPRLDPSHVMECLERLDTGDSQRVLLPARDGQSLMIADWATLRASVHDAYGALASASDGALAPIDGALRPGAQASMGRQTGVSGLPTLQQIGSVAGGPLPQHHGGGHGGMLSGGRQGSAGDVGRTGSGGSDMVVAPSGRVGSAGAGAGAGGSRADTRYSPAYPPLSSHAVHHHQHMHHPQQQHQHPHSHSHSMSSVPTSTSAAMPAGGGMGMGGMSYGAMGHSSGVVAMEAASHAAMMAGRAITESGTEHHPRHPHHMPRPHHPHHASQPQSHLAGYPPPAHMQPRGVPQGRPSGGVLVASAPAFQHPLANPSAPAPGGAFNADAAPFQP